MINNFDVLKEMGNRNMKVQLAPLGNITHMRKVKAGTQITIGFAGDVITPITLGQMVGGLVLADKSEFYRVRAEMETTLAN